MDITKELSEIKQDIAAMRRSIDAALTVIMSRIGKIENETKQETTTPKLENKKQP